MTRARERTIRSYLSALENSGYLSGDNKKPKTFTLLYDVSEIQKKLIGTLVKGESADSLMCRMRKEAQEWLKTVLEIGSPLDGSSLQQDTAVCVVQTEPSPQLPISDSNLGSSQSCLGEQTQNNRQIKELPNPRKENIDIPNERGKVCGRCALWHKPGCSYPEGEPSCVTPLNRYAIDCRDFLSKEALVKGACDILNGSSGRREP
jgi:hypothetical protein